MNNQSTSFSFILSASSAAAVVALSLTLSAQPARAQAQSGGDRVPVTLSDPSRPANVKVSLINGGITVKAYDGKEVIVEAHPRNRDRDRDEAGPKRLSISSTGLSVEEENNEVRVDTES